MAIFKGGQNSTIKKGPSQDHNFGPILRAKMAPLNLLCSCMPNIAAIISVTDIEISRGIIPRVFACKVVDCLQSKGNRIKIKIVEVNHIYQGNLCQNKTESRKE